MAEMKTNPRIMKYFPDCNNKQYNNLLALAIDNIFNARDKQIIKLYFGIVDGRLYTQQKIAEMFNIPPTVVNRSIKRSLNAIRKTTSNLKNGIICNNNLFLYFPECIDKQKYDDFLRIVHYLSYQEQEIITLYFGFKDGKKYLMKEISSKLKIVDISKIIHRVIKTIKKLKKSSEFVREKKISKKILKYFPNCQNETYYNRLITIINQWPNQRKREMLQLYFGLTDEPEKTLLEIAKKYNITQQCVQLYVQKVIKKIQYVMAFEVTNSIIVHKRMLKYFPNSQKKEYYDRIIKIIGGLPNNRNKQILQLYLGLIDGKTYTQKELATKFCISSSYIGILLRHTITLVNNLVDKSLETTDEMEKAKDDTRITSLFKTPIFKECITILSKEESIIIILALGLDGKPGYSTSFISEILEIEEIEVRAILQKALHTYKEYLKTNISITTISNEDSFVKIIGSE